jgi:hypothetical protein
MRALTFVRRPVAQKAQLVKQLTRFARDCPVESQAPQQLRKSLIRRGQLTDTGRDDAAQDFGELPDFYQRCGWILSEIAFCAARQYSKPVVIRRQESEIRPRHAPT